MAGFVACAGTGLPPVDVRFSPSQPNGLGFTQARTFGNCSSCGYTVGSKGDARRSLKVPRHKSRAE